MADYLDILEKELEKRGYKRDNENESLTLRKKGHVFSKEEHLKMFIYALLTNQREWEPVVPHLPEIDEIFFYYEYDKVKAHSGEYYTDQIRAISCGNRSIHAQMDGLNANIHTFERLIEKYGSLDSFVLSKPAYNIVKILADPASEYKMIQLGEALAWEYLRNVGIDGAKPDMHLRRFFGCHMLGVSDKEMAPIEVVLDQVDILAETTGRSKFEIDYILWTSLSQGLCNEDEIRRKIFDSKDIVVDIGQQEAPEKKPVATIKVPMVNKEIKPKETTVSKTRVEVDLHKSEMYTYEEAIAYMENLGLGRKPRADDISGHYRQFADNSSSIHIHNKKHSFILYATDADYYNLKKALIENGVEYLLIENNNDKQDILNQLMKSQNDTPGKIVIIKDGNRIMHKHAEKMLKHEVYAFTNEGFRFISGILAQNDYNLRLGYKL